MHVKRDTLWHQPVSAMACFRSRGRGKLSIFGDTVAKRSGNDRLKNRPARWRLWRDHRVCVPCATIQNGGEAGPMRRAKRSKGATMRKRVLVGSLCLWFFAPWLSGISWAGDAEVLPKGVFKIDAESKFYFPTTKRFNPDGDLEDVAIDFNTSLDSSVFPGLRQLESALGLPAGFAKIGESIVSVKELVKNKASISCEFGNSAVVPLGQVIVKDDFHVVFEIGGVFTPGLVHLVQHPHRHA